MAVRHIRFRGVAEYLENKIRDEVDRELQRPVWVLWLTLFLALGAIVIIWLWVVGEHLRYLQMFQQL